MGKIRLKITPPNQPQSYLGVPSKSVQINKVSNLNVEDNTQINELD